MLKNILIACCISILIGSHLQAVDQQLPSGSVTQPVTIGPANTVTSHSNGTSVTSGGDLTVKAGRFAITQGHSLAIASGSSLQVQAVPYFPQAPSATPNHLAGTAAVAVERVQWFGGEANITYTWSKVSGPTGTVTFSSNGVNGSIAPTATFPTAGVYVLRVTAAHGSDANSYDVPVTIDPIPTTLALAPTSASVYVGNQQVFTPTMTDQFGVPLVPQPASGDYTWTVTGGGTISGGTFTATTTGGPFTVQATLGSVTDISSVTVTDPPTPPTIIDQPDSLTVLVGQTATFSVSATGAPPLTYQWEQRPDSSSAWTLISGATSASYQTPATAASDSGSQFRVIVDNGNPPPTPSNVATLTVKKHEQTITFEPLAPKTYGDAQFSLTGTASSGLPVEYTNSHPAVATITNNNLVTIVGGGTTTITASQSGNGTYLAAESVPRVLTVNRATQTITFGSLAEKTIGDASFALTGTISSNEAITYTSSDTDVASIAGNVVTLHSPGDIIITASHDGNTNYLPAAPVEQPLRVNAAVKQSQTISFNLTSPVVLGEGPVQLTATSSSGLAVTYSSPDQNITVTPQGLLSYEDVGTAQVTASQSGNFAFHPATPVTLPLQINAPPTPGAPQLLPPPGTYSDTVEVALSVTPTQAVIFFTTDGSDPTTSSTSSTYSGPIMVDRSTQLKAFAINAAGVAGPSATANYTIKVVQPVLTPSYGTFAGSISVTATSGTSGAILQYTTGDEAPSPSWQEFPVPLVLSESATLRVMASREGCVSSEVVIGTYTKREPAPPILDPPPGTYFGPLTVTMTASPSDLTVWYAQIPLGQTPVTPEPGVNPAQEYTGPIQLESSAIIRAVSALDDGTEYHVGGWAGGTYTIISINDPDDGYSLGEGGALASAVSPAGIEGQGSTEAVTFSASSSYAGESIGVATVTVTGEDSYFANAPLQSASAEGQAQTTTVTVKVRDPSGNVELITRDVTWTITNLDQIGQPDLIIRQGDSIQLAAAGDGPGALLINPGNLQNGFGTLATTSNIPVKVTYREPGYYYASAWKNGALLGDRKIVVIGLTAGLTEDLAAQVDVERSVTIGLQPKGATAMVEVHAADDQVLDVDVTNIDYEGQTITVALTPLDRGLPVMILRASPGGPILAAKVIDEFTLELLKVTTEWPSYGDGVISAQTCVMRPAIPGLKAQSSAMPSDFDETMGESISVIGVPTNYQSPGSYQIPVIRQRGVIISKPGNFSAAETTTATLTVDYEPGDLWGSLVAVGTANLDGDEIIDWLFPDINITIAIDKENAFLARRLRYTRPREIGYQNSYVPGRTYANYRYLMPLWAEVTTTPMPTVTQDVYHLLDLSSGAYQWTGLSVPCQPVMFYNPARIAYGLSLRIGAEDISAFTIFQTDAGDVDVSVFDNALNQYTGIDANGNPVGLRYEISVAGHQYWQQYDLGPPADLTTSHENNPEGLEIEVATGPRGFASVPIIVNRGGIPISMGYGNYAIPQLSAIVDLYPGTYGIGPFTLTVTGSSGLIVDDNYINDDQELITGGLVSTGGTLNGFYEVYPNFSGNLYRLPQTLNGSQTAADLIPHYYLLTDYDEHGDASWLDIFQGGAWESFTINFQRSDTRTNWRVVGTNDNAEWIFTGGETSATKTVNQGTSLAVSPYFEGARDDQSTLTVGSQGVSRFKVTAVGVSQGKGRGSVREPAEGLLGGLGSVDLEKGNLHLALPVHVDLFPGAPMSVSMHYNLHDYLDCGYGPGWMTNFDTRLLVKGDGHEWTNMIYIHDDGRRLHVPQGAGNILPGNVRSWEIVIPDEGTHVLDMRVGTSLPAQNNGGWNADERFCLRLNNGNSRYFTSDGYLKRVSSLNVPDITVHRDDDGRITHLSDANNRRYPSGEGEFSAVIGSGSITSPIDLIPLSAEAAVTVAYAPGGKYKEIERLEVQGTTTASQFKIQGGDGALRYVFGYTDLQDQKIRCVNDVKVSSNGQDEQRTEIARVPAAGLRSKVTVTRSWSGAEEWRIGASGIIDGEYWTYNDVIPPTGPGSRQAFWFYNLGMGTGWAPMASYFSHIGTTGDQYARSDLRFSREGRILSSEVKITNNMSLRKTYEWKRLVPEGESANDILLTYLSEEVTRGLTGIDDIPLADIVGKTNLFSDLERFGMVRSLQNADGFSRDYSVNRKDPYPRKVIDERQNVWKNGDRNEHGQPQSVESPENYVSDITYDDKYSVSSVTTGFGYHTAQSTDTRGLALETTLPGGAKRTGTYDPFGRVTWMIDEMEREVSIEYDVLGRVRKKTFVPGPSDDGLPSGVVPEEVIDYVKITGPSGIQWKETAYKAGGKIEENIYDAIGRLVEKKIPRTMVNGSPAAIDCSTTYVYHPTSGFLQSVDVAEQSETTFEHDLVGNVKTITSAMGVVRSFERNALGWVTRESIGSGASQLSTWTTYTRSGAVARTVNAAGGWIAAGFDEMGNAIGQRTSEGKRATRKFDKDGRLFQVSHPGGDTYTLEYDPSGEGASLALQIKTKRNEETNPITTMEFNHTGAHRKTYNLVNGETFVTTYERRDDGSERTVSIPGLQTTTIGRDGFGRTVEKRQRVVANGPELTNKTIFSGTGDAIGQSTAHGHTQSVVLVPNTGEVNETHHNAIGADPQALVRDSAVLKRDERGNILESAIYTDSASQGGEQASLVTKQTYDADDRLISRLTPDGVKTVWHYDGVGRVEFIERGQETGPLTPLVHYTYNQLGNVISVTDDTGRMKSWTYDTLGNRTSETVGSDTTTYVYNPDTSALATVIHPDGKTTRYIPDGHGRLGSVINPRGFEVIYAYDDLDRVVTVTRRPAAGATDPDVLATPQVSESFTYWADSQRRKTHTDIAGRVTSYFYDGIGRLIRREIQDDNGLSQGDPLTIVYTDYDDQPAGGVGGHKVTTYVGWGPGDPPSGEEVVRTFDRASRLTQLTLPGQNDPIALTYDVAGRISTRGPTTYTYKPTTGQLDEIYETNNPSRLAKFNFVDPFGRLTSINLPNGLSRSFTYDGADRLESATNSIGSTAVESWGHDYDAQGRIEWIRQYADGEPDPVARTHYAYRTGRLISEQRYGIAAVSASYGYDANGNRTSVERYETPTAQNEDFSDPQTSTLPSLDTGWEVSNGQLAVNLPAPGGTGQVTSLTELTLTQGAAVRGPKVTVTVNPGLPASNLVEGTVGAGLQITIDEETAYRVYWRRQYDGSIDPGPYDPKPTGRLVVEALETVGGTTTSTILGISDPVIEEPSAPVVLSLETGSVNVLTASASNAHIGTISFDCEVDLGPVHADPPPVALAVTATGNCPAQTSYDDLESATAVSRTVQRQTYDGLDRLLKHEDLDTAGQPSSTMLYGRDDLGRLTNRMLNGVQTVAYTYDGLDRTKTLTNGTAPAITYGYMGPEWMRRSESVNDLVQRAWTYDDQGITGQMTGGQTTMFQRHGGSLLWDVHNGVTRSYALDTHGNVSGIAGTLLAEPSMTPVSLLTQRFDYDAWGSVVRERMGQLDGTSPAYTNVSGTFSSGPRYRGMWYDGGADGLYKTATRFYDPKLGQFTQEDPARAGSNWYAYCGGDPVNRMDPSGLDWVWNDGTGQWDWDGNWDGESNVQLADVPFAVRSPPRVRGNPGERIGINFYRQARLLDMVDPNAVRLNSVRIMNDAKGSGPLGIGTTRRLPDSPGYVDPDPAIIRSADNFLNYGSKGAVVVQAGLAAVVAAPTVYFVAESPLLAFESYLASMGLFVGMNGPTIVDTVVDTGRLAPVQWGTRNVTRSGSLFPGLGGPLRPSVSGGIVPTIERNPIGEGEEIIRATIKGGVTFARGTYNSARKLLTLDYIEVEEAMRRHGVGRQLVESLVKASGDVRALEGVLVGTNGQVFRDGVLRGLTADEAARLTPMGQWAESLGLTNISMDAETMTFRALRP